MVILRLKCPQREPAIPTPLPSADPLMSHRSPDEIQIDGRPLSEILEEHDSWLRSGYKSGSRARLAGANLSYVHLADCDLRQADLVNADLSGADLSRTRLNGAALCNADFRHATLSNADLSDDTDAATTQHSPLIGPVPTEIDGISVGGADLTIAVLPDSYPLARIVARCHQIARGARWVGAVLGVLLALSLYWVLTTADADLLLDSEVFRVPFTRVPVTTAMLYWLVPPEILVAFFWWHLLYLDRLWRCGARLPALFPDGSSLSTREALWPLNVMAARWMPQLEEETSNSRWERIPQWLIEGGLCWAAPVVLAAFWWRYLALQEPWGVLLQIVTLSSAVGLAHSRSRAIRRQFKAEGSRGAGERGLRRRAFAGAAVLGAVALAALSYIAVESPVTSVVPARLEVQFAELSRKPQFGAPVNLESVAGADLRGRSLRFAVLSYCFLVNADFRGSRLEGASLAVSDLRGADLRKADLRGGSLFSARLADAKLAEADLRGANLRCAVGLTAPQLSAARTDASTILPDGSAGPFRPGSIALNVNADDCTHWQPDGETLPLIERPHQAPPPSPPPLRRPDLGPIPELKPRTNQAEPPTGAGGPSP